MMHPIISRTGVYGIAIYNENVLLVKQQFGPQQGKWDLPGGGIEPGETIEEALRREFCEEVGMRFESMQLIENLTAMTEGTDPQGEPYILHQIGLIYMVSGLSMQTQPAEMEYLWIHPEELKEMPTAPLAGQMLLGSESPVLQKYYAKFH